MNNELLTSVTLDHITRFITVRGPAKDQVEKIVLMLIQLIVTNLQQKDMLFAEFYSEVIICGSWRDDIKINAPDEIDLNIIFELNEAILTRTSKGYVNVDISAYVCKNSQLSKFADSTGHLRVIKLQSWLEGLLNKLEFTKGLQTISDYTLRISLRKTGPAHTFHIEIVECPLNSMLTPGFKFSVDLVPAIRGTLKNWFPKTRELSDNNYEWVAIPKPLNGTGNVENTGFIPSFPHQENSIMKGKSTMKAAIRLMKQIVRRKSIGNLKSYFIKTAFLWANKKKSTLWNGQLEVVLEKMLERLVKQFKKRSLPNYWDPEFNMLRKFNTNQIDTMRTQLQSTLKQFRKSRNRLAMFELFVTTAEKKQLIENLPTNYGFRLNAV